MFLYCVFYHYDGRKAFPALNLKSIINEKNRHHSLRLGDLLTSFLQEMNQRDVFTESVQCSCST